MKRQDLSVGQIIAYKNRRQDNPDNIYKATITDLQSGKWPVLVEIETYNGQIRKDDLQLWQILGDWQPIKAAHDLRKAQWEIARLKREIASKDRETRLTKVRPMITETLQIPAYSLKTSFKDSSITLELSDTTLENLVRLIQDNTYQARRIAFLEERLELAPREVNA